MDAWHVIHADTILTALRRVADGEQPDLVYAEPWANSDHEHAE